MAEIIASAEMTHIKHAKDGGIITLIAWFRAELEHRDEATKERLGVLSDMRLEECQTEVEVLAKSWRIARQRLQDQKSQVA